MAGFSLKTYDLGEVREMEVGWTGVRSGSRGRTAPPTKEQIKKWNHKQKAKKYRRLIEANFKRGDNWVCFKYKKGTRKPLKEVISDFARCRRQIREIYRRAGQPFRYLYRLEYGRNCGVHIHMICNYLEGVNNIEALQTAWHASIKPEERTHGAVDIESLSGSGGYDQLAEYICKEPESDEGGQLHLDIEGLEEKKALIRMHASKNLHYPKPEKKMIARKIVLRLWREDPKPAPGYAVVKGSIHRGHNPVTGTPYIHWKEIRLKEEKPETARRDTERKNRTKSFMESAKGRILALFRRLSG